MAISTSKATQRALARKKEKEKTTSPSTKDTVVSTSKATQRALARKNGEVYEPYITSRDIVEEKEEAKPKSTAAKILSGDSNVGGTFLGGYKVTSQKKREYTAEDYAAALKAAEEAEERKKYLATLDLDAQQKKIDALSATIDKGPKLNIHAFGGYDADRKTEAERELAVLRRDYNEAESLQYSEKGKEALGALNSDIYDHVDNMALWKVSARKFRKATGKDNVSEDLQALYDAGLTLPEIEQLVDYRVRQINEDDYVKKVQKMEELAASEDFLGIRDAGAVAASVASVPLNLGSGLGYLDLLRQKAYFKSAGYDRPLDYNTAAMSLYGQADAARSTVSQRIMDNAETELGGEVGAFLYQTGMSMADSAVVATLGGLGLGAGGTLLLGGSAATAAAVNVKNRGGSDEQALLSGAFAGAAETVFEKVSIDNLLKTNNIKNILGGEFRQLVSDIGKQSLVEGSEELFTEFANFISDQLIMGGSSAYEQSVREYMAQGMTEDEARAKAAGDFAIDCATAFIGGAISGGIMGGAVSAGRMDTGNNIRNAYAQAYAENTLRTAPESPVATQVMEKVNEGKKVSGRDIKKLERENQQAVEKARRESAMAEVEELKNPPTAKVDKLTLSDGRKVTNYTTDDDGTPVWLTDNGTVRGGEVDSTTVGQANKWGGNIGRVIVEQYDGSEGYANVANNLIESGIASVDGEMSWELIEQSGIADALGSDRAYALYNAGVSAARSPVFRSYYRAGILGDSFDSVDVKGKWVSNTVKQMAYEMGQFAAKNEKAYTAKQSKNAGFHDNSAAAQKLSKNTRSALDRIGKTLGVEIRFAVESDHMGEKENGRYDPSTATIIISPNAANPAMVVVAHETTHRMQELHGKEYKDYRRFVVRAIEKNTGTTAVTALRDRYNNYYREAGRLDSFGDIDAMDELAADYTMAMIENGTLFRDLAQEHRSIAKRLLDALKRVIDRLTGKEQYTLYGTTVKEMREAQRLWERMFEGEGTVWDAVTGTRQQGKTVETTQESEYTGGGKNGVRHSIKPFTGKTFPPYNISHSEANTLATRWAHRYDVKFGDQRLFSYHGSWYVVEAVDDGELGYKIVEKLTDSQYRKYIEEANNDGEGTENRSVQEGSYRISERDRAGERAGRREQSVAPAQTGQQRENRSVQRVGAEQTGEREIGGNGDGNLQSRRAGSEARLDVIAARIDAIEKALKSDKYSKEKRQTLRKELKVLRQEMNDRIRPFRYSLKVDTDYLAAVERGDMDTAQRMVDEAAKAAGYTIKAYHGTSRGDRVGNVFLPERATSGPMAFFTDNRSIAENYSQSKRDTSMAYDPDFDSYETQFRIKAGKLDMPLYRAWGYLPFDARRRIAEKAGQLRENWEGDGELMLDPDTNEANGGFQWQLKESRGNAIRALIEQWLNSGTLFNDESRFLDVLEMVGVTEEFKKVKGMGDLYFKDPNAKYEKVYDTYLRINNPFDTAVVDEQFIADLESWYDEQDQDQYVRENMESDMWDKNGIDAYDFAERLRNDLENNTTHAWTSIPDAVTDYLKQFGHDGIKDAGGKNGGEIHTVWIPFSSEQVKSSEPVTRDDNGNVIPLSERFNEENNDIRYSLKSDAAMGRTLRDMAEAQNATEKAVKAWVADVHRGKKVDVNIDEAERVAQNLISDYRSSADKFEVTGAVLDLFNYLQNGDGNKNMDTDTIKAKANTVADILLSAEMRGRYYEADFVETPNGMELSDTAQDNEELRAFLRGTKIVYPKDYVSDLGTETWTAFTEGLKGARARLSDENNRANVDTLYRDDLSRMWPQYFPDSVTGEAAMMQRIAEVSQRVFARTNRAHSEGEIEAMMQMTASDILDRFFNLPQVGKTYISVRNLREKSTRTVRRLQDQLQVRDSQGSRASIIRKVKALDKKLRDNTEKSHVPDYLRSAVLELCSLFTQNTSVFSKSKLLEIRDAYDDMLQDENMQYVFDEDISDTLKELSKTLDGRRLSELTGEELQWVGDVVSHFSHLVNNANQAFMDDKRVAVADMANKVISKAVTDGKSIESPFAHSKKPWLRETDKFLTTGNLKPLYFFENIGGQLRELFQNLLDGSYRYGQLMEQANEFKERVYAKYNADKWLDSKEKLEMTTEHGDSLVLDVNEALSILATFKREVTNREQDAGHLTRGGVVYEDEMARDIKEDKEEKRTLKEVLDSVFSRTDVRSRPVSAADVLEISKWLRQNVSEQAEDFVDEMVSYLSIDMAELGNETSMKLTGIRKYTERFYFPYKTSAIYRATKLSPDQYPALRRPGFSKRTQRKANNPIVLRGFTDVWSEHVSEMITYATVAVPQDTLLRVLNYKDTLVDVEDGTNIYKDVKSAVSNAYGIKSLKYIEDLLKDLNGGVMVDPREKVVSALVRTYKRNAVGFSFSVVVQQPMSGFRAMLEVDPKYMFNAPRKGDYKQMKQYAGVVVLKEIGGFDTNTGLSGASWLKGEESFFDKAMGYLPQKADQVTWMWLWNAVKAETRDKRPELLDNGKETEAFLKAAGDRFNYVIEKTQVYDSVLTRTQNMRAKSGFVNTVTSFMSEPMVNLNVAVDAIRNGDKTKRARAFGVLFFAIAATSLAKALWTAGRDDDESEAYFEKVLERFVGYAWSDLLPWNYVPIVRDISGIFEGYSSEINLLAPIEDTVTAGIKAYNKLMDFGVSGLASEEVVDFVLSVGNIFGVPLENIKRDFETVLNDFTKMAPLDDVTKRDVRNAILEGLNREMTVKNQLQKGWRNHNNPNKRKEALDEISAIYSDKVRDGQQKGKSLEEAKKSAKSSIQSSCTNYLKPIYQSLTGAKKNEVKQFALRISVGGKQLYADYDFSKWNE